MELDRYTVGGEARLKSYWGSQPVAHLSCQLATGTHLSPILKVDTLAPDELL